MSQAPWYKREAANFISDIYVQAMSDEQCAWYSKMIDLSWIATPQGYLPNDNHLIWKMVAKCSEEHFIEQAKIVLDRFSTTTDGKHLYHPKMVEQAENISKVSESRSHPGKSGRKKVRTSPIQTVNKEKSIDLQTNGRFNQLITDGDLDLHIDNIHSVSGEMKGSEKKSSQPMPRLSDGKTDPEIGRMARSIVSAHPRTHLHRLAAQEAAEAIKRESLNHEGPQMAYDYLLARTNLYKTYTDKWPADQKQFITGAPNFFKECIYRQDEKEWMRHDSHAPPKPVVRESLTSITNRSLGIPQ